MGCKNPVQAIIKFQELMEKMKIQNPISKDIESDLLILSSSVNPIRLKNNPIELDIVSIRNVYSKIVF